MRKIVTCLLLFIPFCILAQPPAGYYDAASGLVGEPLRDALEGIIDNHSVQSYNSLWSHFQNTDNNGGIVWDMYSDNPDSTNAYNFSFGSDQCGNYSAEGDCYNREHSFPQSWFGSASPMRTDLFHVYPTDGWVNGQRSNHPFGETANPWTITSNGSRVGSSSYPGFGGTVFEPIDAYKGDFARSYFYMLTRYKSDVSGWSSQMLTGDNFTDWARNMLLQWHADDPVSTKEINRNNAVYNIQGNRNPFIDNPQYATLIWTSTVTVAQPVEELAAMYVSADHLVVSQPQPKHGTVRIFDITGSLIVEAAVSEAHQTIPLPAAKGMYIAQFVAEGTSQSLKIVR